MPLPRWFLRTLECALKRPSTFAGSKYALTGDLIPEASVAFLTVKRWAVGVLIALGHPRVEVQFEVSVGSYTEVMKELNGGWEKKANLDSLRNAVSRATQLFDGLLSDPPGLGWDGITLYRLREEGPNFPCVYYLY